MNLFIMKPQLQCANESNKIKIVIKCNIITIDGTVEDYLESQTQRHRFYINWMQFAYRGEFRSRLSAI